MPSQNNHAAISWQHCYVAGTGESGYIVPRPDNPDIVYVGAIGSSPGGGNSLQRYDRSIDQIRLITSWPEMKSGYGASEHKQRFAWTYPIVISPHDPNTLYIGGDRVLKSTNEGQSWEPISPDLTKADPETLKPTGGPVNKDAIGAETFATVFALIESPHEAGVLWAGSDDGLIHLTRDSGASWHDVTPSAFLDWTLVSCIEPHPTDPGTVYVAATRYKNDDFEPYLFVTRDYGQNWARINDGIASDHFTRVIRADAAQPGLLFAGTEVGLYVSTDDGAHWDRFQLNLPVSPLHDLVIKDGDLVAGTHGRSIWILDDLTPLRALAAGVPDGSAYLFTPRETVRVLPGIDWSDAVPNYVNYISSRIGGYTATTSPDGETIRQYLDAGENPPRGAIVTYRLAATPEEPIKLTFKTADGTEIRSFTSRTVDDPAIAKERRVPANAGWNRFVWDLHYAPITKIEGKDPASEETIAGPIVAPGEYSVTLTIGDTELTETFKVVKPGNVTSTDEDLKAQEDLLLRIHRQLDKTTKAVNQMRDLRGQLDGWAKRTKESDETISKAADELKEQVLEIEKTLLVPDLRAGWGDNNNTGMRLRAQLSGLTGAVSLGDYPPTDAAEAVYTELTGKIDEQINAFNKLVSKDVAAFNKQAATAKLGAVGV